MTAQPAPTVSRRFRFPLVWIVPALALMVAGWMVLREWARHGSEIQITFVEARGVEADRTTLQYKGVTVGSVKSVALDEALERVVVKVQLQERAADLARAGSQFWIVQPEIGFSGVRGLEAIIAGVHLTVRPGDGPPAAQFQGLDQAPPPKAEQEGQAFLLRTTKLGGVQTGAPVKYRDVTVGRVETSRLADDATAVVVRIRIENAYADLVRMNSRFWNAGGLPIQFSVFGGRAQTTSLEAVVSGAIAFATPDEPAEVAPADHQFTLHDERDEEWLDWSPSIAITSEESTTEKESSVEGLPDIVEGAVEESTRPATEGGD